LRVGGPLSAVFAVSAAVSAARLEWLELLFRVAMYLGLLQ
jgi:hypothetical protein